MNRKFLSGEAHLAPGFTLIELLVTMLVGGILVAIAVPAFNNFVLNDRDIGQANSLVSSLNYARSESIKQNIAGGVTVCPSLNGTACAGSAWSQGWIVTNAAGTVLSAVPALAGSNTLTAIGSASGVTFASTGLPSGQLTIRICDARGAAFARDVEVNAAGRVAASQTPGQSVSGAPLVCP
jgi:type IV fimbrial biogenesis protein FimT